MGEAIPKSSAPAVGVLVAYRSLVGVTLLTLVTLCCYLFYLSYRWAQEINGLLRSERYNPTVVLLVSVFTLGIGGIVYECLFARDLEQAAQAQGLTGRFPRLAVTVLTLNVAGLAALLIPFAGPFLALALGIGATLLVQHELNKFALWGPVG